MKCSVILIVYFGSMLWLEGTALLLDEKCVPANNFREKIMHGATTELESTPWMALIVDPYKDFICGGSLINKNFVLTAAHCIKNERKLFVNLGVYDRFCPLSKCKEVEEYNVVEKFTYNVNGIERDIGLLKLDRPVEYKAHIRPICIILDDQFNPLSIQKFSVFGWGEMENGKSSRFLRSVTVHRRNVEECKLIPRPIPEGRIYAGAEMGYPFFGDSGGPLNAHVKYNGTWIYAQFGTVKSLYRACNYSTSYMDVMKHKLWIEDIVSKDAFNTLNKVLQKFRKTLHKKLEEKISLSNSII